MDRLGPAEFSLQDLASILILPIRNADKILIYCSRILKYYQVLSPGKRIAKINRLARIRLSRSLLQKRKSRKRVLQWAEKPQTSILLASIDWEMGKTGPVFGISVMVGPNGKIIGRYNKIFLIPFETLPFSEWFPEIAEWLRKEIRNMSEFEKGTEYTVFQLNPGQVSASICLIFLH